MDRKRLNLRCDPEQYSTLLWPPVVCNHSCIRQELAGYTRSQPVRALLVLLLMGLLLLLLQAAGSRDRRARHDPHWALLRNCGSARHTPP